MAEAYVPCIRLVFCGRQLDLTFASLPIGCLPAGSPDPAVGGCGLTLPSDLLSAAVLATLSQRPPPAGHEAAGGGQLDGPGGGGGREGRQTLRSLNAVRTAEALLAVGGTAIRLHPPLHLVVVSIGMERARQRQWQNSRQRLQALLATVPNVQSFRAALILIKGWAKARGVYGNDRLPLPQCVQLPVCSTVCGG